MRGARRRLESFGSAMALVFIFLAIAWVLFSDEIKQIVDPSSVFIGVAFSVVIIVVAAVAMRRRR